MFWSKKEPKKTNNLRTAFRNSKVSSRKITEIYVDKKQVRALLSKKFVPKQTKTLYGKKINFSKYNPPKIDIIGNYLNKLKESFVKVNKVKFGSAVVGFLLISFLVYICFIDTIFVIKNYKVSYQSSSYLHQRDIQKYTNSLQEYKVFGVIPANQFWFINGITATNIAKKTIPEIEEIKVTNEIWPDSVELQIKVQDPLLTVKLFENNQLKYWQIAKDGRIFTENINRTTNRILTLQNRINLDQTQATLQDFQLQNNNNYLNKLYFVVYLWDILEKEIGLTVSNTFMADFKDEDVVLITENDTKLYFSSNNFDKISQYQRIKKVFDSEIGVRESAKKLEYIDFRIPQKIFVKAK